MRTNEEISQAIKNLKKILVEANKESKVDNDFERVYSIRFDKFKKVKKEDLIEVSLLLLSILIENDFDTKILTD